MTATTDNVTPTPSLKDSLTSTVATVDKWGEANAETGSMLGGVGAVTAGIVVLNAAPALAVTGSIIYTLFSLGNGTQKALFNRWSKDKS